MTESWHASAPGIAVRRADPPAVWILRMGRHDTETVIQVSRAIGCDLPDAPNRLAGIPPALWLAPGEYMLLRPMPTSLPELPCLAHLADMTDASAAFRIAGESARDFIAKGCTLDLHPRVFGERDCARSALAQVPVTLYRIDDAFMLICERSYAAHLIRWFEDAILEFALER